MYYYQIQDVNGEIITESFTPYDTGNEAAEAAKDHLVTRYPPAYPIEIRISDRPPGESNRYFSSTYYMDAEMVRQHALKRIEEANRKELTDILLDVLEKDEIIDEQYNRGLMTPSDFVRAKESMWIGARINIEAKGG